MHRLQSALVLVAGLTLGVCATLLTAAADSPVGNPDIYEVLPEWPSPRLQTLNPLTARLKGGGRTITFAYEVSQGCSSGNMRQTLQRAMDESQRVIGVRFIENATPDLTIFASCGVLFTNKCDGATACLPDNWPYKSNIYANTIMASFFEVSQVSIWLHELSGHALATWNEQYQLGGGFQPTPSHVTFMNVGPDSRVIWAQKDVDRWERTMYPLTVATDDPPYTNCTTYPGWAGTVSCYWPSKGKWLWSLFLADGREQVWEWSNAQPAWRCVSGCP